VSTYDFACTVTGAGGFVGSQLCKALMAQEDYAVRIFAVDVTPGRLAPSGNWTGINRHGPNYLTFEEGYDVHQPLRSDFLAVDAIYHFAGIANPDTYLKDPIKVMDLNLMGLKNILERIVLWGAHRPRIIYSSTSEVYGLNTEVPFDEETGLHIFSDQRRWCYALSKLVGEQYLRAYADHGIRHTIFRFFNFVGPDIDAPGAGRVLTRMVASALDEGVIHVTEPGTQTRCFTHQDDFVEPLMMAMFMKKWHAWGAAPHPPRGAFVDGLPTPPLWKPENSLPWDKDYTINLGTDEEITMLELAERIRSILAETQPGGEDIAVDTRAREEIYGKGYEDCPRRRPSIERAKEILGWTPQRRLDDFLPDLIAAIVDRHLQGRAPVGPVAKQP
jgi:UDP-glucose 4-epimerase